VRAFAAASDTESPQGVIGVFPERAGPRWPSDPSLVVALDGVRDPGNVGSIIRSAAAAGADGVLVLPECADPFGAKVVRAAMGAHFRIPLQSVGSDGFPGAAAQMEVVLADAAADRPYTSWDWLKPAVIVIGGEAEGASSAARERANVAVRIPMAASTESLNAAAAAAVLLFHAATVRAASRQESGIR
jgi:TrmH family RNA methyltransferase